ncbi:hypothetical protein DKL61_00735 [Gammaproteobacteria bacterium ESL0073]|nr:hypothetical protein DKL61_00735 [Gammaproteobacteria bacterium ESL0073]
MRRILLPAFLFFILPNIFFILASYWTGDDRPFINIDYLLPLLCFTFRHKIIKTAGIILFIAVFVIDLLLITLQHFPNLHFRDTFYLISFIFSGPKLFLIYGIIIIFVLIFEIILSLKLSAKLSFRDLIGFAICLIIFNSLYHFITQDSNPDSRLYRTSLIGSNVTFFLINQEANFSNLLGGDLLKPTPYKQATMPWSEALKNKKLLNKKLLLIVVESWGQPLDSNIQEDILKNVKAKSNELEYFHQGSMPFRGFTVEGELRELCQLHPETVDLYQIKTGFQNCLPHQLNTLGYQTTSFHGGGSTIYGRKEWYPKAGFKMDLFQEDFKLPNKCIAFDGACDWDIIPFIKQSFTQDKKLFNYWLTLTSHYSYYTKDIHNTRFNCKTHNLSDGDACHNFMLQTQLFDDIANLISSPEMHGVEVIIVGDHPPPLFKANEIALFKTKQMNDASVGWVHFKIKD